MELPDILAGAVGSGVDPNAMLRQLGRAPPPPSLLTSLGVPNEVNDKLAGSKIAQFGPGIVSSLANVFTLPHDAMTQQVDPMSTEGADRAVDWAATMAGGGAATAPMRETGLGIFGGNRALTTDLSMQKNAARLEAEGVHPDEIWNRTGFGVGPENLWRHEIDDTGLTHSLVSGPAQPITNMVDHPEFFKAYPEMKKLYIREDPASRGGSFDESLNEIMVGTLGKSDRQINETILHELQHAVQKYEDFARGGNPTSTPLAPGTPQWGFYQDRLKQLLDENPLPHTKNVNASGGVSYGPPQVEYDQLDKLARRFGQMEAYRRLAGEVEARNAGNRGVMSKLQRRDTPPTRTEDYPRDQQIIRRRP